MNITISNRGSQGVFQNVLMTFSMKKGHNDDNAVSINVFCVPFFRQTEKEEGEKWQVYLGR